MRRLLIYLLSLLTASVSAQDFQIRRGDCTPQGADKGTVEARAMASRRLPVVNKNWDPNKTYRQLVILIAFKGDETNFSMENPQVAYNKLFMKRVITSERARDVWPTISETSQTAC